MSFERFAKLTLVSIFLIIVAGAIVRMTGSGMGCPDWPKCFGLVIPPTSIDQIQWDSGKNFSEGQMIIFEEQLWSAKNDFVSGDVYSQNNWTLYTRHDYASFNPAHTWTEYVNRLIGAISGLFTFLMLLMSFRYWEAKRKIVYLSALVVFLMGFQGWLGARVVYSVLQPAQITIHMLMALVIVTFMVYLISEIPKSNKKPSYIYDKGLKRILMVAIVLSFIQIALGTQVRQLIDEISSSFDYGQRELWLGLVGSTFVIHRSFAIVLMLVNALLFWRNYKLNLGFKLVNAVFTVVLIEIISGVTLAYFDMMAIMQPVHMVVATVLFVLQIALYFQLKKSLIQK